MTHPAYQTGKSCLIFFQDKENSCLKTLILSISEEYVTRDKGKNSIAEGSSPSTSAEILAVFADLLIPNKLL